MATNAPTTGASNRATPFTAAQITTLDALRQRLDHTAAIARLIADLTPSPSDVTDAIAGIAATLTEQAERLDELLTSPAAEGR